MTRSGQYFLVLLLGISMAVATDTGEEDTEPGEMSIDEMIVGANVNPSGFDLMFDLSGENVLVELDMLMSRKQYEAIKLDGGSTRKKRKAVKALNYRWTRKTIPYRMASGVFSTRDQSQIRAAIAEWEKYTCLRFRETRQSENRIYFDNGRGCYSYVGMTGGSQKIGLAPGCRHKGVIVHEIGHAVGFHHEQNRPDRDSYVTIMRNNIPSNLYYNFKKYPWSAVTTHKVPYDYGSIMHYGGTAFSQNGQYTIRTKNPRDQNKIGNRRGLSFFDIKLANIMYKCNERCSNAIKCSGHSFVGKDCKCWCPGNPISKHCGGTTSGTTTEPRVTTTHRVIVTTPRSCRDQNKHCSSWAKVGYCGRNTYVRTYCKQSCKLCSGNDGGKVACRDVRSHCLRWKKAGFCKKSFVGFMKDNCAKTCEFCNPNSDSLGDESSNVPPTSVCQMATVAASLFIAFACRLF